MHAHPVSIQETEGISRASGLLSGLSVRHLPVLSGTRLVGMLSDKDLHKLRAEESTRAGNAPETPVSALLDSDVIAVSPDDEVTDAIELMLGHKVGALPVVESGHVLIGILSHSDLLGALRERLAASNVHGA